MILDEKIICQQIRRVCPAPFDFWLVNCQNDYTNLFHFFESVNVSQDSEVFTSEGVYPGEQFDAIRLGLGLSGGSAPIEEQIAVRERSARFAYARELQENLKKAQTAIGEVIARARERRLRLWLGVPYAEGTEKLYNSYILIEDGKIRFVHRKKFLWDGEDSEVGVFESAGEDRRAAISLKEYDGIFENRAILICQEADAFYCPKWGKSPTHIPEVRKAKPDFVIIPAHWTNKRLGTEEKFLRQIALGIARRVREPIDAYSAVRKQGTLVCVINYNEAYVCGPVDEKKVKARVYGRQSERGWLRITQNGIEKGVF